MENVIAKPKEGFVTPYQYLLNLVSNLVRNRPASQIEGESIDSPVNKWEDITENDVNITEPEQITIRDNIGWKCEISSEANGIAKIPVKFYTADLSYFLKQTLSSQDLKPHQLGRRVTTEGFYISEESNEIILVVKSNFSFCNGIAFSGLEFKPSMYLITNNGQSLDIDCPIVRGEMQIMYID